MRLKNRLLLVGLALAAWVGSGVMGLRGEGKWLRVVDEYNRIERVSVAIDAAQSLKSLQDAAQTKGEGEVRWSDLRPAFAYATVELDGKPTEVLLADTESRAREGAGLQLPLMEFLNAVAADPQAQGLALNRGLDKSAFRSTLRKDEVVRLIADLKARGRQDILPPWSRSTPPAPGAR